MAKERWHDYTIDSSGRWQYSVRHTAGEVFMYELIHLDSGVSYTSGADTAHWFQWPPNPESRVTAAEYDPTHPISDLLSACIARIQREIAARHELWEVTA